MSNKYFKESRFIKSCVDKSGFLYDLPEVCFLGRSNVGKSTLINELTSCKRLMKTSKTPGLTRLINYALIDESFYICDSPGYGYASLNREHFAKLMDDFLSSPNLKKLYILIDSRRLLQESDLEFVESLKVPYSFIFTKFDKLTGNEKYYLNKQKELLEKEKREYFVASINDNSSLDKIRIDIINTVKTK